MVEIKELSDSERFSMMMLRLKDSPPEKDPNEIFNNDFIMKKLGKGDAEQGKKRMKQLLKRKLYWFDELERVELEALMKCGYVTSNSRNKALAVRDEKGHFDYVVCLLPQNEGMQHMRDKELIASLNRNISEVEWLVPKSQNRIDVVFNLNGKKIGVEIQNSSLEFLRLKEKIDLLDKHFDKWFFIVPKQFVKKYDYFSNSKGKVVSKNDAVKEITEILSKKEDFLKCRKSQDK